MEAWPQSDGLFCFAKQGLLQARCKLPNTDCHLRLYDDTVGNRNRHARNKNSEMFASLPPVGWYARGVQLRILSLIHI